jgi:hypothetical protein
VIFKDRFLIFHAITLMILSSINVAMSQDYEQKMSDYSEKFLAYSQTFVKFATMNVTTEATYAASLAVSDVAKEFYYHTSYLADFLLVMKIINGHEAEKKLVARLLRMRVNNLIKECDDASARVETSVKGIEFAGVTKTAGNVREDLEALKSDLTRISDKYEKEG